MLPIRARVNLGAIAIRENCAFTKAPVLLESHHHVVLSHNPGTCSWCLTLLQRNSWYILQP